MSLEMANIFGNLEALIKDAGLEIPHKQKKKFMLVGTHTHQTTGYSKVTYHLIQELAKIPELEIYHFGFQKFATFPQGYRDYPSNVDVYDCASKEMRGEFPAENGFGYSQLPIYIKNVKPDVIMIYNDAGVICKFLDKIDELLTDEERSHFKTFIYLDQVYITQRPDLISRIDKAAHVYFAFTDYWRTILKEHGITKPIHIIRHGFDSNQFKPLDKLTVRKRLGIPDNMFLLLNLNRNTPRKRHDIVVTAFAELVARHPTKPLALMCICDAGEHGGYPIQEIYFRELNKRKVPIQFHAHKLMISKESMKYTDEFINELYAISDIGITAAEGEGFGLCQFEAMGIGIPQVVPNIGGFKDFCINGVNSITVEPITRNYIPYALGALGGVAELIDAIDLANAAEEYLLDSSLRIKHGAAAKETVLSYQWHKEAAVLSNVILEY